MARSILETESEPQCTCDQDAFSVGPHGRKCHGHPSGGRWGVGAQGPNPGPSLRRGLLVPPAPERAPSKAAGHKHPCSTVCLLAVHPHSQVPCCQVLEGLTGIRTGGGPIPTPVCPEPLGVEPHKGASPGTAKQGPASGSLLPASSLPSPSQFSAPPSSSPSPQTHLPAL